MKKSFKFFKNKIRFSVLSIFILSLLYQSSAQTPEILWWFDTKDASFGQTAMADINGDGYMNLVFGCYRNDSMVYALNALDGSLLWKHNTGRSAEGCNDVAPLIYDIDNDGHFDVIVPASCTPITFCFDGATGEIKWQTNTRGSDSPPTIADLDGDGKLEIIHGQFRGYVICINAEDGSVKWEILVDPDSWIQTAPTIVDLDGDGQLDFVVATWHFYDNNKIYAYKGDDQSLLWSLDIENVVYHGTAVADLDKDGKPELIIGDYNGDLYAINGEDGSILWKYSTGIYIGSPASVADLDGDGNCEIVFVSYNRVIALKSDGTLFWQYSISGPNTSFRGASLSDIDDDGLPDAIFGTDAGELTALKGTNGSPIWSINLAEHYGGEFSIDHAPVVGDFNKDGILDVFVVGGYTNYPEFQNNYGRGYAISAGKGAGPDWPMFQYDIRRTGSLCTFEPTRVEDINLKEETLAIYPNPSDGIYNVSFSKNTDVFLWQISNIYGKLIEQNTSNTSQFKINIGNQPAGVYFLKISDGKNKNCFHKLIKTE